MAVPVKTLKRYISERQSSFDDLARLIEEDHEFDQIDGGVQQAITQPLIEKYYQYLLGRNSQTEANATAVEEPSEPLEPILDYAFDRATQEKLKTTSAESLVSEDTPTDPLKSENIPQLYRDDDEEPEELHENSVSESNPSNEQSEISYLESLKQYYDSTKRTLYNTFIGNYDKNVLIDRYLRKKKLAQSYEEWKYACLKLDSLTNTNEWKEEQESTLYDYTLIKTVTNKMRELRLQNDYLGLLYVIRTNWVRNLGNMGNVNLYRHSHVGTKLLIDHYITESKLCLEALLQSDLDDNYLLGILQQTRRNIGRTALVLSGGGSFGLFHIGVLATLFELDLLPRVISGSSAGAIVASILCVRHKEEIPELLQKVASKDFNIFNDDKQKTESENLLIKISRFFKNGTWFDNKQLANTVIEFLGDMTFREAYNRTGKILNITVSPATMFEQPRLLNNLTAPNVLIWSAVCASCSLPGIFPSSPLYEKDPITSEVREWSGSASVRFVDGSVDNDLPISRLSEMFNIDHIIACQVNIHVFPFLKLSLSCVGGEIEDEFSARLKQNLSHIYKFVSNEMIHLFELGSELGIAKNLLLKLRSVLSQQYSGDITILPDMMTLYRINELLCNPTKEFILREITNGAQATWPKISIIQNHCGQEFALDKAISFIKGRMIVSSSTKSPLQFFDAPIGLIQNNIQKETNGYSHVLDDNLLESESAKSLSLLSEKNTTHQLHSTENLSLYSTPMSARHRRRTSDVSIRAIAKNKSKSFSVTSPSSMILKGNRNYSNNSQINRVDLAEKESNECHRSGDYKFSRNKNVGFQINVNKVVETPRSTQTSSQSTSVGGSPRMERQEYFRKSGRRILNSNRPAKILRSRSSSASFGESSVSLSR